MQVPPKFSRLHSSPFSDLAGPFYLCHEDVLPVVGLFIEPAHANTMGFAHGGLLAALADIALGQTLKAALPEGTRAVTANLNITYLGTAALGDWIEARTTLDRQGKRLVFAACELTSPSGVIAKVAATFAVAA